MRLNIPNQTTLEYIDKSTDMKNILKYKKKHCSFFYYMFCLYTEWLIYFKFPLKYPWIEYKMSKYCCWNFCREIDIKPFFHRVKLKTLCVRAT